MRYVIEFAKTGYIKYTSHLDMQRLFKRVFKRLSLPIEYSQGFNPHPKMGFAQPLSLGYTASQEYLEFNTYMDIDIAKAKDDIVSVMPSGIEIKDIRPLNIEAKSLASLVNGGIYSVTFPIMYHLRHKDISNLLEGYLSQERIMAPKREKKTKKIVEKDIKDQIRKIEIVDNNDCVSFVMELDTGSNSNLSPEQVISSFREYSKLYLPREEIEVNRDRLLFSGNIEF